MLGALVIVLVSGIGVLYAAGIIRNPLSSTGSPAQPGPSPTSVPVATASPTPAPFQPTAVPGGSSFSSQELGIAFSYAPKEGTDTILTKQVDNKAYVYGSSLPYTQGQYVEVLTKSASEDIAQAIKSGPLNGYDASKCSIAQVDASKAKVNDTPGSTVYANGHIQEAVLSYVPQVQTDNLLDSVSDFSACPSAYTAFNGVSYFLTDDRFPTKLIFFKIGQYGISASSDSNYSSTPWQNTLQLF